MTQNDQLSGGVNRETFTLSISRTEYLAYYQGTVKWVLVISDSGLRVKFPADWLGKFVSHNGVYGRFELSFTKQGKLIALQKISEI